MHVLLFNIRTDAADTALGFTTTWINGLAERCDNVSVVTIHQGELDLRDNVSVRSLGGEEGASRTARVRTLYRAVAEISRERPVDACFHHMTLRLAALTAPIMKAHRVPVLLWYAHGAASLELRIAERLVDRCVTSTSLGFGIASDKLRVIGQGVDTEAFVPPSALAVDYERTVITVGRITERKRLLEALRAFAIVNHQRGGDLRFEVIGGPVTERDRVHLDELRDEADSLGVQDAVDFRGPVPHSEIRPEYHRGAVFVNLSETRSLDKAILEAMSSGCVPVSRNASFAAIARDHGLERLVPAPEPHGVASALQTAFGDTGADRAATTRQLRDIVVTEHGLDQLLDRLAGHLRELAGAKAPGGT